MPLNTEEDSNRAVKNKASKARKRRREAKNKSLAVSRPHSLESKSRVIYVGRIPHGFYEDQMRGLGPTMSVKKVGGDSFVCPHPHFHKAKAKEWRLFMSPRVSNTLSNTTPQHYVHMDIEEKLRKEEFDKIFKEVEQLGTSQMSWKKRKEIDEQKRVALGAKPEKGHRMPIGMGMNIKRKREMLEEQKLQDELALGFFRSTKRGKRSTEKPTATDRGLKASEGVFRGGVLYVKPLSTKAEENTQPSGRGKPKFTRKGRKAKHKGKRRR